MSKKRIAIPTGEKGGLEDNVSEVFGRAKTFTLIEVEDGVVKKVEVMKNPAEKYRYGKGPIVVKSLVEKGVDALIAVEIGPSASELLKDFKITVHKVNQGVKAVDALNRLK